MVHWMHSHSAQIFYIYLYSHDSDELAFIGVILGHQPNFGDWLLFKPYFYGSRNHFEFP